MGVAILGKNQAGFWLKSLLFYNLWPWNLLLYILSYPVAFLACPLHTAAYLIPENCNFELSIVGWCFDRLKISPIFTDRDR